jgi:hypothetical protein
MDQTGLQGQREDDEQRRHSLSWRNNRLFPPRVNRLGFLLYNTGYHGMKTATMILRDDCA